MVPKKAVIKVLCCYCSCLLLLCCTTIAQNSNWSSDYLLINCGARENATDQGRREWLGDVGSKFLDSSIRYTSAAIASSQDIYIPTVPLMTARIFEGPASYAIPVSPGRKFLRLHFYASVYKGRNASEAVFDVSAASDAGTITLLTNFNPANDAEALNWFYIVHEYSLNVSGFLNLTFRPSNLYRDAYAFINGIEVVSVPDILSSEKPPRDDVSNSCSYGGNPNVAMETMYRLNVGGRAVEPIEDSGGLFRRWDLDSLYIFGAGFGIDHSIDSDITLSYTSSSARYAAPDLVYSTQRSMTGDATINRQSNLTWSFSVDPGFCYLLRLHFCEIQSIYNKPNERVFSININNISVEKQADVFAWATLLTGNLQSGLGVPYYKDYLTYMEPSGGASDKVDLRLDLHPSEDSKPEYIDAVLNGLEIFKFNKFSTRDDNLAGGKLSPNRQFRLTNDSIPIYFPFDMQRTRKYIQAAAAIGISIGLAVAIFGIAATLFMINKRKRQQRFNEQINLRRREPRTKCNELRELWKLPSDATCQFTIEEIQEATKGFNDHLVIGVGGFGKVYRGVIRSDKTMAQEAPGGTQVAVKRANPTSDQGIHEFLNEINMLSKLRHRHLVSLIGFCNEQDEMILVYDYMANGTMREHLYNNSGRPTLGWRRRLQVCIGAATGLHYLHTGVQNTIIHRDVKTTNILLDDAWVAKVADFGLCKAGPQLERKNIDLSTAVKGSYGYLDPEYYRRQKLTEKSDVYSFGVVLFEVLCSRSALNTNLPHDQVCLAEWARQCYDNDMIEDIVDPYHKQTIAPACLIKFTETAYKCIADRGVDRPSMGDVLISLESALILQEDFEKNTLSSSTTTYTFSNEIISTNMYPHSSNAVIFSDIVDLQGR